MYVYKYVRTPSTVQQKKGTVVEPLFARFWGATRAEATRVVYWKLWGGCAGYP
jgi:hypothetical protein